MTATQTETLVDWAWSLDARSLPAEVRESIARHLLDGYGCALAAFRLGEAAPAVAVARAHPQSGPVRIPGTADAVSAPYAALAAGALVHALDFDDTHPVALVHATAAVLPALVAVGQQVGADGASLLLAAAAGYETVIRLGGAVPHGFHARGLHATSVCGVFAAAIIAARLLELSAPEAVNALGIAGSLAAGSLEFLDAGSDTKSLHPGLAAMAGVTAAELARAGAGGPASILEGRYGLFASYLQQEPPRLFDDLGERWTLTATQIKPYPCCHLSHPSLAAIASLPADLRPSQISRITVSVPASAMAIIAEPRAMKLTPTSAYGAKFSLPWTAAAALLDGGVTVDTFRGIARADIREMAARVEVEGVEYDAPPATAGGRVRVEAAGRVETLVCDAVRPMSEGDIVAKFIANAADPAAATFARDVMTDGWTNP